MLLKIFKRTGPGVISLITVTLIVVWIGTFINPGTPSEYIYETNPMPLYALLKHLIGGNPFLGAMISFILVAVMALLIVSFNTSVLFINQRTFLPALIYILLSGFFPQYQIFNPVLPASIFLLLGIKRIMDGYRKPGIAYNFFDAGILISTGSLIYADLIWFGIVVFIGIALLRAGNLTEIIIAFIGLITPYFLIFGFYYVFEANMKSLFLILGDNLIGDSSAFAFSRITIVMISFASLTILVSIIHLIMNLNKKKIKSRKTFFLLVWTLLISLGIYFPLPSVSLEIFWIVSIPSSFFLAHYFIFLNRRFVAEIFLYLLIISVLMIQIMSLG